MKIHEYNEMMAYLLRPEPKMQVADLADDLQPGSLKDELLKDFDPSQETYEEYLQRKSLDRPFNMAEGGRVKFAEGTFTFKGNPITLDIKGLSGKSTENVQNLLKIIEDNPNISPEEWFAKTSKVQGASSGLDQLARDLLKYVKGETKNFSGALSKEVFDKLKIKKLIKNEIPNLNKISGKVVRQAAGTAARAKKAVTNTFEAVMKLNEEFKLDPDVDIEELAEQLYGKGASKSVSFMNQTRNDIARYVEVLKTGTRRNLNIPNFKYPSPNQAADILDSIEFSSKKFEKFLQGVPTVQKSHMGDLYNQFVTTGNIGFAPQKINAEALKTIDANLKAINEEVKSLFKNKPKGYVKKIDALNQLGDDFAAASQGYKKYQGIDPYTGKDLERVISFSKPSQELDPSDLIVDEKGKPKKLSELTEADKSTLAMLKKDAMKAAKLPKKEIIPRRIDPEFAAQERAKDLAQMTDDFEEVGLDDIGMQEYTEDYKI
jgi:hypothetical protein